MTTPSRPDGDRVIGQALKWSLGLALLGVFLIGAAYWVLRAGSAPVVVQEAAVGPAQVIEEGVTRAPAVSFVDVTTDAGIDFVHTSGASGDSLLPETMGGGVAFFDADGDLDPDLVLVNGGVLPGGEEAATSPTIAYYRNEGGGQFTRIAAEQSGLTASLYGMGVATGDYDGDADVDLYITAVGANVLYRNLGDGRFEEVTDAGVAGSDEAWSTSAVFTDIDRDGDLDLFVANYVQWSREIDFEVDYRLAGIGRAYGPPTNYPGSASYLFRNEGKGAFVDVSQSAGVAVRNAATDAPSGKALAVMALDVNGDDWVDLLVANDTVGNFLLLNDGDGTFSEAGTTTGFAFDNTGAATGAMGMDVAWFDDAHTLSVAVGNFANEMSSYYVSELLESDAQLAPVFTDEAAVSGIGAPSRRALTFGLLFFDYDLDGHQDLLQINGHVEDEINIVQPSQQYAQAAQLFWRCGEASCPRPFSPVSGEALGPLARPRVGRGAAYADIDLDGDLDLLITAIDEPAVLLRNDTPSELGHRALALRLRDDREGQGNRFGLGALVTVTLVDGTRQRQLITPARSYLSQVAPEAVFGLGAAGAVSAVEVRWPDGEVQSLDPVPTAGRFRVTRGVASAEPLVTP
ncbi:MAG: CRTAC1 family protein [Pseudomonadota bacterium]